MAATVFDDGVAITNAGAGSTDFSLLGGTYGITVAATFGGGSVTWNVYAADGTTKIAVLPQFTANGYGVQDLPPGNYNITIATATATYVTVNKIRKT